MHVINISLNMPMNHGIVVHMYACNVCMYVCMHINSGLNSNTLLLQPVTPKLLMELCVQLAEAIYEVPGVFPHHPVAADRLANKPYMTLTLIIYTAAGQLHNIIIIDKFYIHSYVGYASIF